MWYPVASLLAAWAPPKNWRDVSGAPNMVEKALWVVGETLEKPSTQAAMGPWAMGVSFSYAS